MDALPAAAANDRRRRRQARGAAPWRHFSHDPPYRYPLPTDTEDAWWVFEPDGRLTASVTVPLGLRMLEIGDDYLLGLTRDDLDVQRLEIWGLQR